VGNEAYPQTLGKTFHSARVLILQSQPFWQDGVRENPEMKPSHFSEKSLMACSEKRFDVRWHRKSQ